jgi:hypothetical protein
MVEVPILVRITAAPMEATPATEITEAKVVKVVKDHNGKTLSALTFKTGRMAVHCLSDEVATAQQIK